VVLSLRKRQNLYLSRREDSILKVESYVQTAPVPALLSMENALSAEMPIRKIDYKARRRITVNIRIPGI
jgi:hypothetical protein